MTIKEMIEKRNALNEQAKSMLDEAQVENRSLTSEQEKSFNEIIEEVEELDKKIEEEEQRSIENAVEVVEEKEERSQEMDIREQEIRALEQYIRRQPGEELRAAMQTNTSNGALVPTHLYDEVVEKLEEVAPLFSMVKKLTPVAGNLTILSESSIGTGAFVGEGSDVAESEFAFNKVELKQRRAGSVVKLTQQLINDSGISIVDYAKDILYRRLGYALDRAMITGQRDADNSFEGLDSVAGNGTEIESAANGSLTINDFINVANSMHPSLQGGAVWVMHRDTFNAVSQLDDSNGNHFMLRQQNPVDGTIQYKLLGMPIYINDACDKTLTQAGDKVAFLVNFEKAYAGMIKKDMEIKHIDSDTANALAGTSTLMIDMYADCVVKDKQAIRILKMHA